MAKRTRQRSRSESSYRKRDEGHAGGIRNRESGFGRKGNERGPSRGTREERHSRFGRSHERFREPEEPGLIFEKLFLRMRGIHAEDAASVFRHTFNSGGGEEKKGGLLPGLRPSRSYRTPEQSGHGDHGRPAVDELRAEDILASPAAGSRRNAAPLQLDEWQQEAFVALQQGQHVVVDAPTSAGKTRVIEALIEDRMDRGLKLIYTSPVKSLSNDKYREFVEKYGKSAVGINTGDFKENLGAPIILATLETYRNALLGIEPDMRRKVVVYDEYHYLQDESRGSAWEESIILTPQGSQLVLLSASVPNPEDFAGWIASLTGEQAKVIRVTKRPVPLSDLVHTSQGWVEVPKLQLTKKELDTLKAEHQKISRKFRRRANKATYQQLLSKVVQAVECGLGPTVVYAARRAEVENLAHALARLMRTGMSPDAQTRLEKLQARLDTLPGWEYVPAELQRMVQRFGVAFHHSGMIPPARVAIESLLKEGLLEVCCGTMGISLGVNFAVRSAFVADETRPGEFGEKPYSNSEILQMLGRAGRRGHDAVGYSLWSDLGKYARFRPVAREDCVSSLKFDPSTVMGLLGREKGYLYLAEFYQKSLFMRNQSADLVLIHEHDILSARVYDASGGAEQACSNIPEAVQVYEKGKRRSQTRCAKCPSRKVCHPLVVKSRQSPLNQILSHLEDVGAVKNQKLTEIGQLARHFPQSGGLLIACWLANREMTGASFRRYVQALAAFCSAHFKEIPDHYADQEFLESLRLDTEIEFHYPQDLFPDYYDDVKGFVSEYESPVVFRELNLGAPSIVEAWLRQGISWEQLVAEHSTKYFSAGDCMMVLFRFATYLQSCARLVEFDADIAAQARRLLQVVLREPLDARNRMLMEEIEEEEIPPEDPLEEEDGEGEGEGEDIPEGED